MKITIDDLGVTYELSDVDRADIEEARSHGGDQCAEDHLRCLKQAYLESALESLSPRATLTQCNSREQVEAEMAKHPGDLILGPRAPRRA